MNVLVTGDRGYIGSVLTEVLIQKGYSVTGFDTDYYKGFELFPVVRNYRQITKDIRNISTEDLRGIDAIIHLAALSNDPLGELSPDLTEEINLKGTLSLAQLAIKAGCRRFIYSSSQSMYGVATTSEELDEDNSQKNPVTVYARTKWDAECQLKKLGTPDFCVVCFRPSTVFGVSPRLRCDIVYNNLVACAFTTGKIEIKSDGTPWRPVVHVRDVVSAFIAGLEAPVSLVENQSFNVGIANGNFTVRDLAEAAHKVVKGCSLVFTGEHGADARTYKVSFKKILSVLKDYYKPEWDLIRGGNELVEAFTNADFTEKQFRGKECIRLAQLKFLLDNGEINNNLFWN